MKLVVLSDNRKLQQTLGNEHGLCIYLETEKYKCLLDTGASDLFIRNAEEMVIDLKAVDYVFISHGHSDHIGGLQAFLQINQKAKIVVSGNALTQDFYSVRNGLRNISSKIDISKYENQFVFIDSETVLENEISVFPCRKAYFPLPKANSTLMAGAENSMHTDDFNHEIIVCFGSNGQLVYTGCAHHGILNILGSARDITGKQIATLIGGFHLLDGQPGQYESEEEINQIAGYIAVNYPETMIYTGHCTGDKAYALLKKKLSDNLKFFHTGFTISVSYTHLTLPTN
jgi:7,8-dihydropterin-6-yl-methyl-4-(beta-D-ribofuranosyl)aminobenzene 5'-phosphate synthase